MLRTDEDNQTAQIMRTLSSIKEKRIADCFDLLTGSLTSAPRVHHTGGHGDHDMIGKTADWPFAFRWDWDIFLVRISPLVEAFEMVKTSLLELHHLCRHLTIFMGSGHSWADGDVKGHFLSMTDARDGSGTCTFVFAIYWTSPEAMARFKDPAAASFESGRSTKGSIDPCWWQEQVLARFERFKKQGALVQHGTVDIRMRTQQEIQHEKQTGKSGEIQEMWATYRPSEPRCCTVM